MNHIPHLAPPWSWLTGINTDAIRWEDDVRRIRGGLRDPNVTVLMRCFNEEDRDEIRRRLTPEERRRVRFTWLVWK